VYIINNNNVDLYKLILTELIKLSAYNIHRVSMKNVPLLFFE